MSLSLLHKGLILLTIPFLFHVVFIGLVFRFQSEHAEAQKWDSHTIEVIAQAQQVQIGVAEAQSGVRGYVVSRDVAFVGSFADVLRDWQQDVDQLADLVRESDAQSARVESLREKVGDAMAWQSGVVALMDAKDYNRAIDQIISGEGKRRTDSVREEIQQILAEEQRLDRDRAQTLARSRERLLGLLVGGGIVAVLTTAAIAYLFRRGISRRFDILSENARRLAGGHDLATPLTGGDEIAAVDREFHAMAAALRRTSAALAESVREIHDLYDNAPCGYHSVESDGTVVAINQTELRWLGYEAVEVVGRMRFADFVSPASRAAYRAGFARVREFGDIAGLELELARRDGTTFPVLVNSTSVRAADGTYLRSRTSLTDLTERKKAEDEVRRLNNELEQRVQARTAELAAANRDLIQKNDENEMFVYSVSHDLRSPLVNLQGFSKSLEKGRDELAGLLAADGVPLDVRTSALDLLSGKMTRAIGFIQAAVLRLSSIIDALLRLSRAGRVEYRWEQVDVRRLVERVVASYQVTIAERGATVTVDDLPPAWGDATALEQVFANLIGNALAYLSPARRGVIHVGCRPPTGDLAAGPTYFVADNGLGIAESHRAKIFQVFQRAHPGVGSGEGIGLALVARVTERHHGRSWVESRVGEGSTFFVSLRSSPQQEM